MKNDLTILRYESSASGTFGVLVHDGKWLGHTLEPANRDGLFHHAVTAGRYTMVLEYSPKFGRKLPTLIVNGRIGIRIHAGNYVSDTSGCILVGDTRGEKCLYHSTFALNRLVEYFITHHISHINIINYEDIS